MDQYETWMSWDRGCQEQLQSDVGELGHIISELLEGYLLNK